MLIMLFNGCLDLSVNLLSGKMVLVQNTQWFSVRLHLISRGWSGGAMVLGKLPVLGRPTIRITVGQGPTALAVGAGVVVWIFLLSSILSLLFLPLFGWLVGCFGFNGPLRQHFSLYWAVSQREGEKGENR